MKTLLRHIGGALGTGLVWAFGGAWAGLLVEGFDPHGTYVDVWVAALFYPGFVDGVIFFTLLRVVGHRRKFDELSFPRAAGWGVVSALLVPALFALVITVGLAALPEHWLLVVVITGLTIMVSAGSACVLVALARLAKEARPELRKLAGRGTAQNP